MKVRVTCPSCGMLYGMDDSSIGRRARCRECGGTFSISGTQADSRPTPFDSRPTSGESGPAPGDSGPVPGGQPSVPDPMIGRLFAGRYKVEAKLGAGGMGSVYRAIDQELDRAVALKVPHFRGDENSQVVDRFVREAKVAAKFDHPNLCQVIDVGNYHGTRYLTMPLIDGEPLSKLMRPDPNQPPRPVDEAQSAQVARLIAEALAEAHSKGVIHRDLKPANVLIHRKRGPVVVDFGLARPGGPEDARLTRTGAVFGTPAYMAPEQVDGDHAAIGPRTDVYALGVLLYEMLTGRQPFEGRTVASIYVQIMNGTPTPPLEHRPGLDSGLIAIALKAMARSPSDRYASMEELARTLAAWQGSRSRPTTSPNPPEPPVQSHHAPHDQRAGLFDPHRMASLARAAAARREAAARTAATALEHCSRLSAAVFPPGDGTGRPPWQRWLFVGLLVCATVALGHGVVQFFIREVYRGSGLASGCILAAYFAILAVSLRFHLRNVLAPVLLIVSCFTGLILIFLVVVLATAASSSSFEFGLLLVLGSYFFLTIYSAFLALILLTQRVQPWRIIAPTGLLVILLLHFICLNYVNPPLWPEALRLILFCICVASNFPVALALADWVEASPPPPRTRAPIRFGP